MAASAPSATASITAANSSTVGEGTGGVVHADDRCIGGHRRKPGAHRLASRRPAGHTTLGVHVAGGGTTTTTPSLTSRATSAA